MKVGFYAPLNAPDAPIPSGDRLIARMLIKALALQGHEVRIQSRLRSLDMAGDDVRQRRLERIGARVAQCLVRDCQRPNAWRPDVWLSYHLYHKAPDWIGPAVAAALGIPYVVVEASYARKHEQGLWARSLAAVAAALAQADLVIGLKPDDARAVAPRLRSDTTYLSLKPFLDVAPFANAYAARDRHRAEFAASHRLDLSKPWLIAVGMMRDGSKLKSYGALFAALSRITDARWQLLIAGDGPAENEVLAGMRSLGPRASWLGRVEGAALARLYAAGDLFVWPAIKEPIGMVFIEAQAAGLPIVAGDRPGVRSVVAEGESAVLVPEGDLAALAAAVKALVADPVRRAVMSVSALLHAQQRHDVATGGRVFAAALAEFVEQRAAQHR
ncbi:MAG: glycosyltransferase family 4 protein [Planctomycetota bacterium]|nr:glycosyltransferase family 4 protein [Planctomycetota bacterium]